MNLEEDIRIFYEYLSGDCEKSPLQCCRGLFSEYLLTRLIFLMGLFKAMLLYNAENALLQYGKSAEVEEDTEQDAQLEDERTKWDLLCRQCLQKITSMEARTVVHGQHRHVFFNPHGIVFEIGCFYSASGYVLLGSPTKEFSWFKGYSWQILLCSNCQIHLGWRYMSADGGFYGLILKNLVSESERG